MRVIAAIAYLPGSRCVNQLGGGTSLYSLLAILAYAVVALCHELRYRLSGCAWLTAINHQQAQKKKPHMAGFFIPLRHHTIDTHSPSDRQVYAVLLARSKG